MKISELMEKLGEAQGAVGDVDVWLAFERDGAHYYAYVFGANVVGADREHPCVMLNNRKPVAPDAKLEMAL